MKRIIFFILVLFFLSLISAFQINSSNYKIDSVISAGGDNVTSGTYNTKVISGIIIGNTSSSSFKQFLGFFFCIPKTCSDLGYGCDSWSDGCRGTIDCGTCSSGYTCSSGICIASPVTPVTPSGGGGPSCTYDWICTNWFPEECPVSEVQERLCVNRGTCKGTEGMPNQTRNCTYEAKEPLFDIFLTIPKKYEKICIGEEISASVKLQNYGKIELLDAFMTYWIVDSNNSLISEVKDTRNIAEQLNFDISIKIPDFVSPGTYKLYTQITYSGNKTAVAGQSFNIIDGKYCKISVGIVKYYYIIIGVFILLLFLFLSIIIFRRKKRENREGMRKILRKIKRNERLIKLEKEREYARRRKLEEKRKKEEYLIKLEKEREYRRKKKAEERKRKERYLMKLERERERLKRTISQSKIEKIPRTYLKPKKQKKKEKKVSSKSERQKKKEAGIEIIKPSLNARQKQKRNKLEKKRREQMIEQIRKLK